MSVRDFQPDLARERVSIFVKIFVFFHIVAITSWTLPHTTVTRPLDIDKRNVGTVLHSVGNSISNGTLYFNQKYVTTSPVKFYLYFTGFWQYWDMFSPNPASIDFYCTAVITYKDGTTLDYAYPRMYSMGIPKKYISERYRKFYERVNPDDDKNVWPYFAQRIALINFTNLNNPPVQVKVTRHWFEIAPPEGEGYAKMVADWEQAHPNMKIDPVTDEAYHKEAHENAVRPATNENYKHYDFFTFQVDQMKLMHDKNLGPLG